MTQANGDTPCHFFLQGRCKNGALCKFSHNVPNATPGLVCKFFQAGMCAFGSNCRYDHVKTSSARGSPAPAGAPSLRGVPKPAVEDEGEEGALSDRLQSIKIAAERQENALRGMNGNGNSTGNGDSYPPSTSGRAWMPVPVGTSCDVASDDSWMPTLAPALPPRDKPLCLQFLINGCCPDGDDCRRVHGKQCPVCRRHCLHPFRKEEHEAHIKECTQRQAMDEARAWSSQFECGICLETVLSPDKPGAKFGLLTNCAHSFCLDCIREWRRKFGEGLDVDNALRACPICRQVSFFIVPSPLWPRTDEEKAQIIEAYKGKLKTIDCRHFDFGRGSCPFGTSCFYRHCDEKGVEDTPELRRIGKSDGEIAVLAPVRLSDFLATPNAQRLLRGGRRR